MTLTNETRRAGLGAAGLLDIDCLAAVDTRVFNRHLVQNQTLDRAQRRILVARLHLLGPAPLAYFLEEIERGASAHETLMTYASPPPDFIRLYGGDKFAPALFAIPEECQ